MPSSIVLNENHVFQAQLLAAPTPALPFSVTYEESDDLPAGLSFAQGKTKTVTVEGTIPGSSAVNLLPATPLGKIRRVVAFSILNTTAGAVNLTLRAGATPSDWRRFTALPAGDNVTHEGIFSNAGVLRFTGTAGTNAVMTLTSTTSNTIGAGSLVWNYTNTTNLGIALGTRVRITNTPTPTNYCEGQVTAISATSMTVNVNRISGSGTFTAWTIGVIGEVGSAGAAGINAILTRTSTDNISIGTGAKVLNYASASNLGWLIGTRLRFFNSATNYMEGQVTAVSATQVTINSDLAVGAGSFNSWNIAVSGDRGVSGLGYDTVVKTPAATTSATLLSDAVNGLAAPDSLTADFVRLADTTMPAGNITFTAPSNAGRISLQYVIFAVIGNASSSQSVTFFTGAKMLSTTGAITIAANERRLFTGFWDGTTWYFNHERYPTQP